MRQLRLEEKMANDLRERSDALWNGVHGRPLGPGAASGQPMVANEVIEGIALVEAFGNCMAVRTDEGLVVIDTSLPVSAPRIVEALRVWDPQPVTHVIYTHGHGDHVLGMPFFDADAEAHGYPRPHVIAHENVPPRFDRYAMTGGYNAAINSRQFQGRVTLGAREIWRSHRYPDETYRDQLSRTIGGVRFDLYHGKGETDDHTWVHLPERDVIFPGDLFIWVCPNAGNPQKVQRYPVEWAQALRAMAAKEAEVFVPSHNLPIFGRERVKDALTTTAELLESLVEQTLALMNEGAPLDEVLQRVEPPAALMARPFLAPTYDEPEFIVRNIWRQFGGWYGGNPAQLKPAPEAAVAAEVVALAGGVEPLIARARELLASGDLRLAAHLVEFAVQAHPESQVAHAARSEVYAARAREERSLMAKGIFGAAAAESAAKAEDA